MKRTTLLLLGLLATAGAACSDDDPAAPVASRSFSLTITGALAENAAGAAHFGTTTDEQGQTVFGVVLGGDTTRHVVVMARSGATRPDVGEYEFADMNTGVNPWGAIHVVSNGDVLLGLFQAVSGELEISVSTAERLKGSFEFTAEGFIEDDPTETVQVTVKGSFDAAPAPVGPAAASLAQSNS